MRHDWIFDVLTDLRSYAVQNGLRDLADQVEITNLQRQVLNDTSDLGKPKVEDAARKLKAQNPHVE